MPPSQRRRCASNPGWFIMPREPWSLRLLYPVDPAGGGVLDVGDGLVRSVVEDGRADALGLVEAVDGFHQGVVVGVADRPDRGPDALEFEVLGESDGRASPRRCGG